MNVIHGSDGIGVIPATNWRMVVEVHSVGLQDVYHLAGLLNRYLLKDGER